MPQRRKVQRISATQLEFGDDFHLSGIQYRILDIVVRDTVLIEFVPTENPFADSNMMIVQKDTRFLKFSPIYEAED